MKPLTDLSHETRLCVQYASSANLSFDGFRNYYKRVVERDRTSATPSTSLAQTFPSARLFHSYCINYRRIGVIENGWVRAVINLPHCPSNRSGCFTYPLALFRNLLSKTSDSPAIIPFSISTNTRGERVYNTVGHTHIRNVYRIRF